MNVKLRAFRPRDEAHRSRSESTGYLLRTEGPTTDVLEQSPLDRRVHLAGVQTPLNGRVRREISTGERRERRLGIGVN